MDWRGLGLGRPPLCGQGGAFGRSRSVDLTKAGAKSTGKFHCLRPKKKRKHRVRNLLFSRAASEDPKHDGEPWRREIMRITKLGADIWAGAYKQGRRDSPRPKPT
jgi:hypothetical protein